MNDQARQSPFQIRNIRLFIAFRVFFNARFYYPVFTILFLDFGLSLEQFAVLNAAWAATIVLLEVPSGALADIIGRKNLLVTTGGLMVVEIALLCFVPRGNIDLLFAVFLVNRILSGAAEAAASGADEAIAYDSLKAQGDARDWPRVLERQMRIQSMVYIGAMSLGAAVYDPALVQQVVDWLGWRLHLDQGVTLRFPLYLTLVMAGMTLICAVRMEESGKQARPEGRNRRGAAKSIAQVMELTLAAGRWIRHTPFALVLILAGLIFDNCIRMFITLRSQYLRVIGIPEALFGLISSALALLGLVIPWMALRMARGNTPLYNCAVMGLLTLLGLIGAAFAWPIYGIVPVVLLSVVMYLQNFFQSHYLNRITASAQRATVLSFKGLSFNLAYGMIGILYSLLVAQLRGRIGAGGGAVENLVFVKSLAWFPWYFAVTMAFLLVFARRRLRGERIHRQKG